MKPLRTAACTLAMSFFTAALALALVQVATVLPPRGPRKSRNTVELSTVALPFPAGAEPCLACLDTQASSLQDA